MLNARIYIRVSTDTQDLTRQNKLIEDTKEKGFYIAGIYKEKISGATEWQQRPELTRLINDLQNGDVVIAESIDRITRLEPTKAIELIDAIQNKGAKIQVPEVFDFSTISKSINSDKNTTFDINFLTSDLFNALQNMFLKIALAIAHDDYKKRRTRQKQGIAIAKEKGKYKGRQANKTLHNAIIKQRLAGISITETAKLLNTSISTVCRVWKDFKKKKKNQ